MKAKNWEKKKDGINEPFWERKNKKMQPQIKYIFTKSWDYYV